MNNPVPGALICESAFYEGNALPFVPYAAEKHAPVRQPWRVICIPVRQGVTVMNGALRCISCFQLSTSPIRPLFSATLSCGYSMTMASEISRRDFFVRSALAGSVLAIPSIAQAHGNVLPCFVAGAGSRGAACVEVFSKGQRPEIRLYDRREEKAVELARRQKASCLSLTDFKGQMTGKPLVVALPSTETAHFLGAGGGAGSPLFLDYSNEGAMLPLLRSLVQLPSGENTALLSPLDCLVEALDSEREKLGSLQRIHFSRGACDQALLEEEHARWLFVFLSLAAPSAVRQAHSLHSVTLAGDGSAEECWMSSLSFDGGLAVEMLSSTSRHVQQRISLQGRSKSTHFTVAGVESLARNLSLNALRTRTLSRWYEALCQGQSLERTPLQHATLLLATLEQAKQNTMLSDRRTRGDQFFRQDLTA